MSEETEIEPLKVFVGWDSREDIAFQVCKSSILDTATVPVDVQPLKQKELRKSGIYTREIDELASTEFTFTRFLVPELAEFKGWALFIDCDFVFNNDIKELFDQVDNKYALMCAQHDYTPKEGIKMDGQQQLQYPRKNWSSMMLINCGHPSNKKLTAEFVNDEFKTGAFLHRFSWLDDSEIGELSHEWNWLVGWYKEPRDGRPKALHYTEGGPWFKEYKDCDYASTWYRAESSFYRKEKENAVRKAKAVVDKRKKDMDEDITARLNPNAFIIDDQKKKLVTRVFNYLKDPKEKWYKSDFETLKEDMMAIRGDRVAAIFDDPKDGDSVKRFKIGYEFDEYLEALVQGIPNGYLSTWEDEEHSMVPLIIRGLAKKGQLAIKDSWKRKRTFYAIDSGYIGNETSKSKVFHRITKNNLQHLGPIIDRPHDRLGPTNFRLNRKAKKGDRILIVPPSEKVMKFWGQKTPEEWTQDVKEQLVNYTDREVVVRLKPKRQDRITHASIFNAMDDDCYCVITYNSIAATEALLYGKPAIALGPNSAQVLCNTSLAEVEHLNRPDPDELLRYAAHLSYCQFTRKEMQSGLAWSIVNEGV